MKNEKQSIVKYSKQRFFSNLLIFGKVGLRCSFLEPHSFNFETSVTAFKKNVFLWVTKDLHYVKDLGCCTYIHWAVTLGWSLNVCPWAYPFPALCLPRHAPIFHPSWVDGASLLISLGWCLNVACTHACSAWPVLLSWRLEGNYDEWTLKS